ncbi:serine hydrolase domain-containing protein [Streptomyces litchfieldiae]|uniref:Serine hydrolase domain-containing protein n=1 Tax=Streptomyces litchfieldiae TaxID=3075543 RepID=A0ABU2N0Q2_9ACTN|nr:serine hydrolase domain-containing protein [Streptomyces sp. DSM 44938]MDT0347478.1 serine hydrolase domain-containing protein [Streptomyces sp. DSM 44938]
MTTRRRFGRLARIRVALAVAGVGTVGVATALGSGAWAQDGAPGSSRAQLQRDADAVRDTGASGLTVRARDAAGRDREARSGVADLDEGGRVPFDAYYRIGSDTKTFVAVVALQLVAEGTLGLDDTVEEWLPGVVAGNGNDGSRITIRNLLQHTSGLANYTDALFDDPEELTPEHFRAQRFTVRTPEEQVALAMTSAPGWLPDADNPGAETRWSYSNTNYVLAGMIIERVTGHSWEQEVHERIIEPLGLRHTMTLGTSAYVPRPTATAYVQFPGREDLTDTTLSVDGGADGGIVSTTSDMNTFLRALMDGTLLPAEQLEQMRTTVPAPGKAGSDVARYGLGIAWRPVDGCEAGVWYHGGTSFGTMSEAAVTEDGSVSAAAAVFTTRYGDEERFTEQAEATIDLIDHAVCGQRG